MIHLSPEMVDKLHSVGVKEAPKEACGLLFADGTLVELPNRSDSPTCSFKIEWADARDALESLGRSELMQSGVTDVLVWHTHPSGLIGPSTLDVHQKRSWQGVQAAVITLNKERTVVRY